MCKYAPPSGWMRSIGTSKYSLPKTPSIKGCWMARRSAQPVTGGTWYPGPYQAGDEQTVLLHFHGGAYVMGEGRPSDVEFCAATFLKHLKAKTLFLSYRLASNENCHFPARTPRRRDRLSVPPRSRGSIEADCRVRRFGRRGSCCFLDATHRQK